MPGPGWPRIVGYVGPLAAELVLPLAEQARVIPEIMAEIQARMCAAGANRIVNLSIDMDPFVPGDRLRATAICTAAILQGG
jgi:hypothetical protein